MEGKRNVFHMDVEGCGKNLWITRGMCGKERFFPWIHGKSLWRTAGIRVDKLWKGCGKFEKES